MLGPLRIGNEASSPVIDWLTFRAPWSHSGQVFGGRVLSVDPEGVIDWQCLKGLPVIGSHSATVHARSMGDGFLEISGNPAKFSQGHNVFGSTDLVGHALTLYRAVCAAVGVRLIPQDVEALSAGLFTLTRVDLTYSWDLGNVGRVRNAIRSLSHSAYLAHRGRGSLTKEGTLYFGKHSRRWALKLYAKGHELQAHRLPEGLQMRDQVEEHASGLLRVELVLRSMELKEHHFHKASAWGHDPSEIHSRYLSKLTISETSMLDAATLDDLPSRLRLVYQSWRDGHDLRTVLPHRTFYRHRAALLAFGVDIAVKQPREETNVVPLRVVLHARPVGVPTWAIGTPLYFEPQAA